MLLESPIFSDFKFVGTIGETKPKPVSKSYAINLPGIFFPLDKPMVISLASRTI